MRSSSETSAAYTRFGDKLVEATEEKKRRELIAEAENDAADQEASRIRKLYAAYLESIQSLQKAIGRTDGTTDVALFEFLTRAEMGRGVRKKPGRSANRCHSEDANPAGVDPSEVKSICY